MKTCDHDRVSDVGYRSGFVEEKGTGENEGNTRMICAKCRLPEEVFKVQKKTFSLEFEADIDKRKYDCMERDAFEGLSTHDLLYAEKRLAMEITLRTYDSFFGNDMIDQRKGLADEEIKQDLIRCISR